MPETSTIGGADAALDGIDRRIIEATQAGLPPTAMPYHAIAEQLGFEPELVMSRLVRMQLRGKILRIAAVPNRGALGYKASAMAVWDVPDERVGTLGRRVGALEFVSHCCHRRRHLPEWPYNLFAMVHGHDRKDTDRRVRCIADVLGADCRGHAVLYGTRVLKKTGLRPGLQGRF